LATLWQRYWYVIIGSLKVEGLRVQFTAKKSLQADPNTLDLKIYNLSETTRANMQMKGVPVVLVAGYLDNAEVVFSGTARTIDHVRERADWVTHIQCGDGEASYTGAQSNISMAAGARVIDVLVRLIQDLQIGAGDAVAALRRGDFTLAYPRYQQGYTGQGSTTRLLDQALRPHGIRWSIQGMALQLLQGTQATKETAVLLSPSTGLIGSPDHGAPETPGKPTYIKIRSLLQPSIRPGRILSLQTRTYRGDYQAWKVDHEGDSHGSSWTTSIEALPR
jgi:hypothetical protein